MPRNSVPRTCITCIIGAIGEAVNNIDGWCFIKIGGMCQKFLRGET